MSPPTDGRPHLWFAESSSARANIAQLNQIGSTPKPDAVRLRRRRTVARRQKLASATSVERTERGDADEPVSGIFERPIQLERPPCEVGCERHDHDSSPPARNLLERSARSLTISHRNHSWPTTRTTLLQFLVAGPVGARVRLKPASGNRNGLGACPCRSGLRRR